MSPKSRKRASALVPAPVLAAIAATATSIVVVDARAPDRPIIYCNAAFEALTGYPPDSVLGRNCRFLQGPDTDPAAVAAIRAALGAGEATKVDLLNYTRDGRPFWNELHLSPVHDDAGELTHFIAFQYDITARKREAAELARLQAQEVAHLHARDGRKDEFLGVVAHELRAPVHALTGLIQLMQTGEGGPLTAQQRADLVMLRQQADVLEGLVGDLLDLGQLQAGQLAFRAEVFDLSRLVGQVAAQLAPAAAAGQVEVVVSSSAPVLAWGDVRRVAQVVRNLAQNAIQASPRGGTVRLAVHPEAGGARLEVSDRGPGILPADRARVFERFVRLRHAADGPVGTGLGLPICKGIVEAQGGHIGIEDAPGGGSLFWCWLPGAPPG